MEEADEQKPGNGLAVAGTVFASVGFLIFAVIVAVALFLWLVVLPGLNVD